MAAAAVVIACGALARELAALRAAHRLEGLALHCLPADLHNRPERIPGAVAAAIDAARQRHGAGVPVFVAYGDCGTAGALDEVLERAGAERLAGPHCYAAYAGEDRFARMCEDEPGTFFLTDFLARHFERLVVRGLGLDRHPELRDAYFGNYRRVVWLFQDADPEARARLAPLARAAAARLGLAFEERHTGAGELGASLLRFVRREIPREAPCPA